MGALIGSIIAPWRNHKYSLEKLREEHEKKIDYMKKEYFFDRKLKYFEETLEKIGDVISKFFVMVAYLERNIDIGEFPTPTDIKIDKCELYFNSYELIKEINNIMEIELELRDLFSSINNKNKKEIPNKIRILCNKLIDRKVRVTELMKKELQN